MSKISLRISRLRWQVPVLTLILVLVHQVIEHTWLIYLSRWQHFATQVLFYGLVGPAFAWWALTTLLRRAAEFEESEKALHEAHTNLHTANRRLEILIRVSRQLSVAEDEEALTELLLDLPQEVLAVIGCSLIRFDEKEEPRLAIHRGEVDFKIFEAWSAHLSSTDIQEACNHCTNQWAVNSEECPLIMPVLQNSLVKKVYCLELERGGRKYGNLNIYLSDKKSPTEVEQDLLKTMANEMSLALESMRLRSRELSTLYYVQHKRSADDIQDELAQVLEHVIKAFEVSGGMIFLLDDNSNDLILTSEIGNLLPTDLGVINKMANSTLELFDPMIINDLDLANSNDTKVRSLLLVPLRNKKKYIGCLVVWTEKPNRFAKRHVRMMSAIAAQSALLIENHQLYLQVENKAALAERSRLSREIHDGLAQTLGFLQLRMAQINKWLKQGEVERASSALQEIELLVDEAYVDTREAIDDLRIKPDGDGLGQLMRNVCKDFQAQSGIPLAVLESPDIELPFVFQIQLLRIVQEALGNIRKHSEASHAQVLWTLDSHWLTLKITDNGRGFAYKKVPPIARHGLRIMQERAELLDADLQVTSKPGKGTTVSLRIPIGIITSKIDGS
ncbi:MAG: GAF domain-containing sensor histidine kinase [Anaerolineae bacterium]|nr:GAF domain-containing sensor histidine kinase [Anaerolineae bacterium]MDK1080738.1 GAF domain-containing sensor histidine kinase [Anaerolineae bacterium]MDK1117541.1 GAF domain-containing sensor histidine kinase [Anaerolineae bacterium]